MNGISETVTNDKADALRLCEVARLDHAPGSVARGFIVLAAMALEDGREEDGLRLLVKAKERALADSFGPPWYSIGATIEAVRRRLSDPSTLQPLQSSPLR